MGWLCVAGVVSSTFVDGDDVVCNVGVRVWLACSGYEVRDAVVDGFAAQSAVPPDAAYVRPHLVLHCSVALDHQSSSPGAAGSQQCASAQKLACSSPQSQVWSVRVIVDRLWGVEF